MKKLVYPLSLSLLVFLFPSLSYSQSGTIKIFSELEDVQVYLDEVPQGTDISIIESVSSGSHYLKLVKDSVIVYGELISVVENETTTVLLKDSKEVQEKLLQGKLNKEQKIIDDNPEGVKQYKEQYLDIMVSTRYITETSTVYESKYYPGYYSSTGKTNVNSVSETKEITDWFIIQGGQQISHNDFAQIIGEQDKIDDIDAQNKIIKRKRSNRTALGLAGLTVGAIGGYFFFAAITSGGSWLMPCIVYVLGFEVGIMSLAMKPKYESVYYDMNEAREKILVYNQNLKKELGLPLSYEPN